MAPVPTPNLHNEVNVYLDSSLKSDLCLSNEFRRLLQIFKELFLPGAWTICVRKVNAQKKSSDKGEMQYL